MADRSVVVRFQARIDQYQQALATATKSTREFSEKSQKELTALGTKYQSLGRTLSLTMTAPLALMAKQAVDYAGTANEAMNRSRIVFGAHADEVAAWAEDSAKSMGLAKHEAISTASTLANMFTEMGLGADDARSMSMTLVQLAADVGSFRDVDPSEMLVRMRAAVVGEYEPLRNMGIVLTDVAVRNEAVKLGLAATREEATASALVQARYSMILKQTSKDQGDYARTADDAVNAQRTAQAAYKDAMVELGDNLLPVVTKGAVAVTDLAEAFSALPEGAQSLIIAVGGIVAISGPMLLATGAIIRNLHSIQAAGPKAAAALKLGGAVAGAFAVAEALDYLGDEAVKLRYGTANVDELTLSLARLGKEGDVGGELVDRFGDDVDKLPGIVKRAGQNFAGQWDELAKFLGGDETVKSSKQKIDELDKSLAALAATDAEVAATAFEWLADKAGVDVDELKEQFDDYTNALAANEVQQILTGDAASGAGNEIGEQATDVLTAAEALDAYSEALDGVYFSAFGADEAANSLRSGIADLAQNVIDAREAGDEWATSLDASNTSGLANISMIQGLVRGGLDLAESMARQGATQGQITTAMSTLYDQLGNTLAGLGFNRAEAERFLGVLMSFPSQVDIKINVDTERAEARMTRLLGLIQLAAHSIDVLEAERWAMRSGQSAPPDLSGVLEGIGTLPTITPSYGSGGSGKDPAAEALRLRQEEDARQGRLAEFGGITVDQYKAYLDARINATARYTAEWADLMHELERVNDEVGEAWREAAEYMEGLEEAGWEMLRRQNEVGDLSTRAFLEQLEKRLTGLQMYSDEWMETFREINQIKDDLTQTQLEIMAAVEKERLYWVGFNEAVNDRFTSGLREIAAAPVVVQGGSTQSTAFSQTNHITAPTTGDALATANQRMRDQAFLMGL